MGSTPKVQVTRTNLSPGHVHICSILLVDDGSNPNDFLAREAVHAETRVQRTAAQEWSLLLRRLSVKMRRLLSRLVLQTLQSRGFEAKSRYAVR